MSNVSIANFCQNAKECELLLNAMHGDWWISYRFHFLSKYRVKAGSNAWLEMCLEVKIYSKNHGHGPVNWNKWKFSISNVFCLDQVSSFFYLLTHMFERMFKLAHNPKTNLEKLMFLKSFKSRHLKIEESVPSLFFLT